MAVTITCQECGKPIKLLRPATLKTPISCCHCGAIFFLQPIETAPVDELVKPLNLYTGPVDDLTRPLSFNTSDGAPARTPGHSPVHDLASPLSISTSAELRETGFRGLEPLAPLTLPDRSLETPAAPVQFIPLKTPPAPSAPTPAAATDSLTSAPLPMVIAEDQTDEEADGLPAPGALPRHLQRSFRTNWLESLLGATLVLALVVVSCAVGFIIWRALQPTATTALPDSRVEDGEMPIVVPAKELPRPDVLAGFWTSRADDGSHSALDIRKDGQIIVYSVGDPKPVATVANWFYVGKRDNYYVLEIGKDLSARGNYLFYVDVTSHDALVVCKTVRFGQLFNNDVRYVRSKPPDDAVDLPKLPP